jgi:hypothetical protein
LISTGLNSSNCSVADPLWHLETAIAPADEPDTSLADPFSVASQAFGAAERFSLPPRSVAKNPTFLTTGSQPDLEQENRTNRYNRHEFLRPPIARPSSFSFSSPRHASETSFTNARGMPASRSYWLAANIDGDTSL